MISFSEVTVTVLGMQVLRIARDPTLRTLDRDQSHQSYLEV
jgi:hypothetical protein